MSRRLPLLTLACVVLGAWPAGASAAPGRVVFSLGTDGRQEGVDPLGLEVGTALPDGGAVLAGRGSSGDVTVVALRPDGSLDPAFGPRGIVRVAPGTGPVTSVSQVLRRPDGRLLVVAATQARPPASPGELVISALTPDGRVDAGFGDGGFARPGVQAGCAGCSPAALATDGALLVTGGVARWVIARLTPAGRPDAGFGQAGIATLPGESGAGYSVAALAGRGVAAVGRDAGQAKLARLTPEGVPDPAFGGGAPVAVPGSAPLPFGILARADERIDVLASGAGSAELIRFARDGALDAGFGAGGVVRVAAADGISEALPAQDGGTTVAGAFLSGADRGSARVTRVSANGSVTAAGVVGLRIGGGVASAEARRRPVRVTPLSQTGLRPGRPFARADGSVLVPGAVAVVLPTGEGTGFHAERAVVAAITPGLVLDPSFGGPLARARITVRLARQRARTAADPDRLRIVVRATTSGPGLAELRVRVRGRTVAHSTAPAFATGAQRLSALLTPHGRRALRRAGRTRVTLTATFRDLVGERRSAAASGTLR